MAKYSDKLKDRRWLSKRMDILLRDQFTCQYCFAVEDWPKNTVVLEVHHFEYSERSSDPWDVPNSDLITLCSTCHSLVMKSKDRDAKITGARERWRMERRAELKSTYWGEVKRGELPDQVRDKDHDRQLQIASICNCPECVESRKHNRLDALDAEVAKLRRLGILP